MSKGQTLQDPFLNSLRKDRIPVSIFLVNGIKLQGQIESFDQYVVLLRNTVSQMVYKHAISTVVPARNPRTAGTPGFGTEGVTSSIGGLGGGTLGGSSAATSAGFDQRSGGFGQGYGISSRNVSDFGSDRTGFGTPAGFNEPRMGFGNDRGFTDVGYDNERGFADSASHEDTQDFRKNFTEDNHDMNDKF